MWKMANNSCLPVCLLSETPRRKYFGEIYLLPENWLWHRYFISITYPTWTTRHILIQLSGERNIQLVLINIWEEF